MTEFHERVVETFVWTDKIPTIAIIDRVFYCNRKWWDTLSDIAKVRFIEHELIQLRLSR